MIKKIRELQEERARCITQARAHLDEAEKRGITEADTAKFNEIHKRAEELRSQISLYEKQVELEKNSNSGVSQPKEKNESLSRYYKESDRQQRALSVGNLVSGGFLATQETELGQFIIAVNNESFMRGLSKVLSPISSQSAIAPSLDTDFSDADWTPEVVTIAEDTAAVFGQRKLQPHPLTKLVKISKDLINADGADVVQVVNERAAYKFGVTEEQAFLTGNGNQRPLGVFTSSAQGVTTARDVSAGNTTTAIKADGLKACKWALKAQYLRNANWMFHRDAMLQIDQLKDGQGQYLLKVGIAEDGGDLLLGRPVKVSEYAPNTFTTGLRVGILGDFSYYWILDNANTTVQVLLELYAATNQNGYIWRRRTDGQPVLAEAFSVVKLA